LPRLGAVIARPTVLDVHTYGAPLASATRLGVGAG
jgi:hypothetical protein